MHLSRRTLLKAGAYGMGFSLLPQLRGQSPLRNLGSGTKDTASPNVILIMVDALRPDHLSFNGYQRDTTPNLNNWMFEQGMNFLNVFSAAPWTYPANAAILSGLLPTSVGASWDFSTNPINEHVPLLAEYLKNAGYQTAGFVTPYVLQKKYGLSRGFDHYDDSLATRPTSNKGLAQEVNQLALDWLMANRTRDSGQPLFLYLYYFDTHSWYNAPPPYDTMYDTSYLGSVTPEVFGDGQEVIEGKLTLTERDVEHLIALYDGELSYWDSEFGRLMNSLEEKGLLQNTLIVVCSDHGEMFGEHNRWVHGSMLYDEVLRVPLLLRYDGVIAKKSTAIHDIQNLDILPTILAYTNISQPLGLHGINLRPWIDGSQESYDRLIFSEVGGNIDFWFAPDSPIYAVRHKEWKLIHQFSDSLQSELFRPTNTSVFELNNEILDHPDIAEQLGRVLNSQFFPNQILFPLIQK